MDTRLHSLGSIAQSSSTQAPRCYVSRDTSAGGRALRVSPAPAADRGALRQGAARSALDRDRMGLEPAQDAPVELEVGLGVQHGVLGERVEVANDPLDRHFAVNRTGAAALQKQVRDAA